MIGDLFEAAALQETTAEESKPMAETFVGAPGTVAASGVTLLDGSEAGPVPTPLVAVTMKVYGVPLVRLGTVQVSGPLAQVQVLPSGVLVTV